jgi:hypothetical protein
LLIFAQELLIKKNTNRMRHSIFFLIIGIFVYSCSTNNSNRTEKQVAELNIVQIVSEPMQYENQSVRFEGTVGHVCRHSGDKMRVVEHEDDAYSILVMLGEFASNINMESEGKDIIATGVVKTQVRNIDALTDHDHDGDDEGDHGCASTEEAIARLKEKGIDADIMVYVELTSFEIK